MRKNDTDSNSSSQREKALLNLSSQTNRIIFNIPIILGKQRNNTHMQHAIKY